jgi:hypothetical protein
MKAAEEFPGCVTLGPIIHNDHVIRELEEKGVYAVSNISGCPGSVICIENTVNAASSLLLELVAASGADIYYSGDMDYSGLALGDRLYLAHPKQFKPWRYDKADYERVVTDNDFYLPEHKKDQGLHNEELAALLSLMRKKGRTASQMALLKDLVNDIKNPGAAVPS